MSEWGKLGELEGVRVLLVLDKDGKESYSKIPKEYGKLRKWAKTFNQLIKDTFEELEAVPKQVIVSYFNSKTLFYRCLEDRLIILTSEMVDEEKLFGKIREIETAKKIKEVLRL